MTSIFHQGENLASNPYKILPPAAQAAVDDALTAACVEISRSGYYCNIYDAGLRDALAVYLIESNQEKIPGQGGE